MINLYYQKHLKSIITDGTCFAPRGKETFELIGTQFVYDANYPVITIPERNIGYKAMLAEAYWILSGSNLLEDIKPWMKMDQYSNNNIHLDGAYGPPFVDQVPYVVKALTDDKTSRRAVISIWRPRPFDSKDIPCTLTLQFLIRNNVIYTIVNMRSSDGWLGLPYDCFTFAMMARYVAICLKNKYDVLDGGKIIINIGSAHVYLENADGIHKVVGKEFLDNTSKHIPFYFRDVRHLTLWLKDHRDMNFENHDDNDMQRIMEARYATNN